MNRHTIHINSINNMGMSDRRRIALTKAAQIEAKSGKPSKDKKLIAAMNDGETLISNPNKPRTDDAYTILQRYGYRGMREDVMKEFLETIQILNQIPIQATA